MWASYLGAGPGLEGPSCSCPRILSGPWERAATSLPPVPGLSICTGLTTGKGPGVGLQTLGEATGPRPGGAPATAPCWAATRQPQTPARPVQCCRQQGPTLCYFTLKIQKTFSPRTHRLEGRDPTPALVAHLSQGLVCPLLRQARTQRVSTSKEFAFVK